MGKIKKGCTVRSKDGTGPEMTVEDMAGGTARCSWFDNGHHTNYFCILDLELTRRAPLARQKT
jgi:uncharacterized protein YodC (DUF2158 family)